MSNEKNIVEWGFGLGGFALLFVLVVYPLWKSINADAKADFCYVSTSAYTNPQAPNVVIYHLWQHVPWRSDRLIGQNYVSLESAHTDATKIGCEIR